MEMELKRGPGRPRREAPEAMEIDRPDLRREEPRIDTEAVYAKSEETLQERAARRTREILEQGQGFLGGEVDKFSVDGGPPDGWSYQWKRVALLGKEDPSYEVSLAQSGWEAVPLSDHPSMMPRGYTGNTIDREGQRLMRRPREISDMVEANNKRAARGQMQGQLAKLGQAPQGEFGRVDANRRAAEGSGAIVRSGGYEAIPVPQA